MNLTNMNFEEVKGKVVIVTGASKGIGEAIARVFAANGMKVVCANRNEVQGEAVASSIRDAGYDAVFYKTDCSKPEEIQKLVDFTMEYYGKLDGIVNDAGIGMGGSPLHEYSVEDCERILNLNLKGVFCGMKYGVEAMRKSKTTEGFIINVASVAGLVPQGGQALYTATKHGVVGMTKSAALDYASHGVTVNAICPGYTDTPIFGDTKEQADMAKQYFVTQCPAGRLGKPEECAYLALFLASDMARYISGAAIPVDGALSAGGRNVTTWREDF